MRFALSPEQVDFSRSINDLLGNADTPAVIRAWAVGRHDAGLALWRKLAELGITALAVPERNGGFGADAVDLAVAFEALGYHGVPGPLTESIAVLPVLLSDCTDPALADRWLPDLAAGDRVGTLCLPPHVPYALDADIADVRVCVDNGTLHEFAPSAVGALYSVDRARRLYTVDTASMAPLAAGPSGRALTYGAFATAAQLLGAGGRLLDSSVSYAKQRSQYGQPIGQYQAIKHLLADVVTQVELARPLLYGAAVALAHNESTSVRDVSAARVTAADAAYLAARTALQVHGAIGYTAEHDLGLWLTKVRALQAAWGTQAFHRKRVLDSLVTMREAS
ncbi:MAG: acyl-CoA dehydrogenase family protein [Haloechinothrix sp.]